MGGKYLWLKDYDGDATETKIYSRDGALVTPGVLKTPGAWFGRQIGTYAENPHATNFAIEQFVKHFGSGDAYRSAPQAVKKVFQTHGGSTGGSIRWDELIAFDATKVSYKGVRGLATFVCSQRGSSGLYKSLTGQYAWSVSCTESGNNFPCEENDDLDYAMMLLGSKPSATSSTGSTATQHYWQDAQNINPHTVSATNLGLRWTEPSDNKLQLKAVTPTFTECSIWLEYTI